MHGVSPPQLSERLAEVIFKTEFNLDGKVQAIPGCYHGKYLLLLSFTAFRGASKGLPGHVPGVMCTAVRRGGSCRPSPSLGAGI